MTFEPGEIVRQVPVGIVAARAAAWSDDRVYAARARMRSAYRIARRVISRIQQGGCICAGDCDGQAGGFERAVRSDLQSEEYFFVYYEQSLIPGNDSCCSLPFFSRRSDSHALAARGMTGAM